jgi:hypothetical protein
LRSLFGIAGLEVHMLDGEVHGRSPPDRCCAAWSAAFGTLEEFRDLVKPGLCCGLER